ncbi:energy-coupling factor transporter ATPase [Oceanobacillus halophilus]|uniref:Energy-coupling factor transporter ATPase n=1 Tax=Oceanobacillus halophilus TaxID=930130 RepID=A0A495A2X2_9BACI|nr:energy-coupling factor transporter ATPase [Oceanobacillus halophilus]RKQ33927.1 energy-coupling factor transporter ATPase [Oceanobacillus halophilus]
MLPPRLQVEQLTFRYDERKQENTLENVSFTVQKGEWLAVVGHNGSGKSTLARLLVGLLTPNEGSVHINGIKLDEDSKWKLRSQIGLIFQNPENQFIGTTVKDDVAFALENMNMAYDEMKVRVEQALEMVGLEDFAEYDPSRLSGGQKQRVAIAGLLALNPSILILDEAMVMLDPKSRKELMETLSNLKTNNHITIISITHDMNEAQAADRILMLSSGQILHDGEPAEVFQKEPTLDVPFAEQLRRELENRGSKVPDGYMTEDEMVRWLCR